MRLVKLLTLSALALGASACSSFNVNVDDTPPEFPAPLLYDGYFNFDGLRDYDGNIIDLTLFGTGARRGELIHLEIWPFAGLGIGLFGVRAQVLPIDVGFGTLLYEPSAPTGSDEPEPVDESIDE
jgi:hypothetical protein